VALRGLDPRHPLPSEQQLWERRRSLFSGAIGNNGFTPEILAFRQTADSTNPDLKKSIPGMHEFQ
jgi:hypothetical protein